MKTFFETHGIYHQTSYVVTQQEDSVLERKHMHVLNVARSLLFQSGLPLQFWGESIITSVFFKNIMPIVVLKGLSLYELVLKKALVLDHLRVFGSLRFATTLNTSDKFFARAEKCVLLGYSLENNGFRLLSLDSNYFFVSRDVNVYEYVFLFKLNSTNVDNVDDSFKNVYPFSYDNFSSAEFINDSINPDD